MTDFPPTPYVGRERAAERPDKELDIISIQEAKA
jgi:hypothetical protein